MTVHALSSLKEEISWHQDSRSCIFEFCWWWDIHVLEYFTDVHSLLCSVPSRYHKAVIYLNCLWWENCSKIKCSNKNWKPYWPHYRIAILINWHVVASCVITINLLTWCISFCYQVLNGSFTEIKFCQN